ncbi:hypothetical protein TNCV_4771171 [Trichonephila clavipes]|nr:hypothetical protein TNCV_4771171 [Trichonephila clavipes]
MVTADQRSSCIGTLSKQTHAEPQNTSYVKMFHLSLVLMEEVDRGLYDKHTWEKSSWTIWTQHTTQVRVSESILTSQCSATRGLLATDHVILSHGQMTSELAPPLLTTTRQQR